MCCQSWADAINSHYAAPKIEPNLTWTGPQTIDKLPVNNGNVWSPVYPPASCCSVILQTQCCGSRGQGTLSRDVHGKKISLLRVTVSLYVPDQRQERSITTMSWLVSGSGKFYLPIVIFPFFFFSPRTTSEQRQWVGDGALGKRRAEWF